MKKQNEYHLSRILHEADALIDCKYRKGVKEHGGMLLEKKGIIDMAIDEAIDQVVYLLTLKEQIDGKTIYTVGLKDKI